MTLKWTAVVVAAVSVTLCVTANIIVGTMRGAQVPTVLNLITIATAASATVLAIVADLHDRIDNRLTALTEFLIARLNEMDNHASDRNAGFVEGYLFNHGQDTAVVPLGPRMQSRRMMSSGEDQ